MPLTRDDVLRIAKLSKLELSPEQTDQTLGQLNAVFDIFNKLQAVDVSGVKAMTHPTSVALRLRPDAVTETNMRESYQQVAPETAKGLYLVPKVIE